MHHLEPLYVATLKAKTGGSQTTRFGTREYLDGWAEANAEHFNCDIRRAILCEIHVAALNLKSEIADYNHRYKAHGWGNATRLAAAVQPLRQQLSVLTPYLTASGTRFTAA